MKRFFVWFHSLLCCLATEPGHRGMRADEPLAEGAQHLLRLRDSELLAPLRAPAEPQRSARSTRGMYQEQVPEASKAVALKALERP